MSKTVFRKDLIKKVSSNLDVTNVLTQKIIDNFLLEIKKNLRDGNNVSLNNFGTFSKSIKEIGLIYSPFDGKSLENKETVRLNLTLAKNLKTFLKVPKNTFLLATHNDHKLKEIESLFPKEFHLLSLNDLNEHEDVEETGYSFEENAYLKAKFYYEKYLIPTIADDSGLVVEALDGRPGIYSKRYSGKGDYENNVKLLTELKGITNRSAYFHTTLCLYEETPTYFTGEVEGKIAEEIKTKEAFGYDSVFIYQGNTLFSDLAVEFKNRVSHRAKAFNKLIKYLEERYL